MASRWELERYRLITAAALLPHTSAQYYLVIYLQLRVVFEKGHDTLVEKQMAKQGQSRG
jgi:hypothetical protein